ncbi:Uncharacterised protein [Mycobacteroides abscessus subsp. abscessus]|nr:Uncharacterised protein [Mycobacteroides abscessus subsp. abscessus]
MPKNVTSLSSQICQSLSASGANGCPENVTIVAPIRRPATWKFHIIHESAVCQKNTSPGPISLCSPSTLTCSTTMPPCPCTIPLGFPVVPELNSTHSG